MTHPLHGGRSVLGPAAVLAAAVSIAAAQAAHRYTATTVNMDPAGQELSIDLLRWSSDEERQAVVDAIEMPPGDDSDVEEHAGLHELPTVGYVWPQDSGLGYSIKYAHRVETSGGGEQITLVTSRRVGSYDRAPWMPTAASDAPGHPFSVIELSIDGDGEGDGTLSAGAEITVDAERATVALVPVDGRPGLLESAKRLPQPYSGG